jgi:hypothetical protein
LGNTTGKKFSLKIQLFYFIRLTPHIHPAMDPDEPLISP